MCRVQAEKVKSQYSLLPLPGPTPTTNLFTFELCPNPLSLKGRFCGDGKAKAKRVSIKSLLSLLLIEAFITDAVRTKHF